MVRIPSFFIVACSFLMTFAANVRADPLQWDNENVKNILAVKHAEELAREFMRLPNCTKEAVQVLEEQLPRTNGDARYLGLLSEAYRSYIKDLWHGNQEFLARKYLERLCVLDPTAARDPILSGIVKGPDIRPGSDGRLASGGWRMTEKDNISPPTHIPPPAISPPLTFPARIEQATVRAKLIDNHEQPLCDDPFSLSERVGNPGKSLARQLLECGETEFGLRRYTEARLCYEKAFQANAHVIDACRDHWAQCIIAQVTEQLAAARETPSPASLVELRKLVREATAMAPSLAETGKRLMDDIDNRSRSEGNFPARLAIRHLDRISQGCQVAESPHFRIFYKGQTRDFVEKVAEQAERTRLEMYRKWFGHDGVAWQYKCDLYLHAGADDYCRITKLPFDSPGYASFEIEKNGMKIVSRRMDLRCDQEDMLDTTLTRETTFVVLAGMFGPVLPPRWAEVGMAVLSESPARVGQHRRNLVKFYQDGTLPNVRNLMKLAGEPPSPTRKSMKTFYAQSVVLVEFLAMQRGPTAFTEFLRDALRDGYEPALRRHYGWTFADLETRWAQYVIGESNPVASR